MTTDLRHVLRQDFTLADVIHETPKGADAIRLSERQWPQFVWLIRQGDQRSHPRRWESKTMRGLRIELG